jgi:hypothetical protein
MSTDTPRLIPIFAGQQRCLGFLLSAGPRGVTAYDASERLIGTYPSALEAATAVERAAAPACPECGG